MKNIDSTHRTVNQLLLTFLLLLVVYPVYSQTYHINHDGSGDFFTISNGIDAADHGDTLLVYPGRYIENLNYNGKNITITSLYGIESDNRSIIKETVIDGNQNGTVITFDSGETCNAVLNGFTITNGHAREGGGINIINNASPIISNCRIRYNNAIRFGGGIRTDGTDIHDSSALIKDCLIEYNTAYSSAGVRTSDDCKKVILSGSTVRYNSAASCIGGVRGVGVDFCHISLNSIYFNHAGDAINDLQLDASVKQQIVIDTFTVKTPDFLERYYLGFLHDDIPDNFSFEVLNTKIEPISADLYVSVEGCDTNTGLTPEEPLKTIALAMSMIKPNISERRNIFVADGIYSKSLNGQFFPIQVRSNVNVIGDSKEGTILDMEKKAWAFSACPVPQIPPKYKHSFSIKNFSIVNGGIEELEYAPFYSGINIGYTHDFEIEDIGIYNGSSVKTESFFLIIENNYSIKNIEIDSCKGLYGMSIVSDGGSGRLENIRINNFHYILSDKINHFGQSFRVGRGYYNNLPFSMDIVNIEITDGVIGNIKPGYGLESRPWGHFDFTDSAKPTQNIDHAHTELRLINATIGNNTYPGGRYGGGLYLHGKVDTEIYNSIIYGNRPYNFTVSNTNSYDMNVSVYNSIVENGFTGVQHHNNAYANIYWDDSNLDIDPLFIGENDHGINPYMIRELSPARGAGTLDIPDFEFPEYDLAGNPRIVDGKIDMGAYQWHPYEEPPEPPTEVRESDFEANRQREGDFNLHNFPNPATTLLNNSTAGVEGHRSSTTGTNIAFELPESGRVMIEIYNLKGQFVKRIYDAYIPKGEHNVFWDGRNEKGQFVATGFYMYNLHFNEQLVATGRATFIK